MTHLLKYVASRIFFGTFAAVFAVYWVLAWVHQVVYPGAAVDDTPFIIGAYALVLAVVSLGMSLWGRFRLGRIINAQMEKLRNEYHPELLVRSYDRVRSYLASCYFFNSQLFRYHFQGKQISFHGHFFPDSPIFGATPNQDKF